jgi:hypothetical protein
MRSMCAALTALLTATAAAQAPPVPPSAATITETPAGQLTVTTSPPAAARTFTAPAGLLFHTVRPDRVAEFEKLVAFLRAALEKSTDPTIRLQARGWRVFRAAEPGPNGTVLYVFVIDPVVPNAEYGFGRILADVFTDPTQLQQIWRLYTTSVTSGGSLLNLFPLETTLTPADLANPGAAPLEPAR